MMVKFSKLIALMQKTLRNNNLVRPTALKNLQIQEDGDPFKILIGTILSARNSGRNYNPGNCRALF